MFVMFFIFYNVDDLISMKNKFRINKMSKFFFNYEPNHLIQNSHYYCSIIPKEKNCFTDVNLIPNFKIIFGNSCGPQKISKIIETLKNWD